MTREADVTDSVSLLFAWNDFAETADLEPEQPQTLGNHPQKTEHPHLASVAQNPTEPQHRRILITGSRDWHDRARLYCVLDEVAEHHPVVLVSGAARGADTLAEEWARARGHQVETHPADWDKFGKRAGYVRNAEMAELGADVVVAFRLGESKGTTMMMSLVQKHGLPLRVEQADY